MDLRANRTKSETSGFRRCDIDAFHGMHLSTTPSISLKKKAREKKERTRRCAAETSISSLFLGPKALAPSRINAIGSLVWRLDRSRPFEKDRETRERERKRERASGMAGCKRRQRRVNGERGVCEGEIRQTFGERDGRGRSRGCGWGRIVEPHREGERGTIVLAGGGGWCSGGVLVGAWRTPGQCMWRGPRMRRGWRKKRATERRRSRVASCLTLRLPPLGSRHAGPKD